MKRQFLPPLPAKTQTAVRLAKFCIVASRFNERISQRLLDGCLREFEHQNVHKNDVTVVWVPGSFELPVIALQCARKTKVKAVICLGAVIRGETYHYELVAQNAARGIAQAAMMTGKPVIFGVLTTDTEEQAKKRSEARGDNKGREAARVALEMVNLLNRI